MGSGVVLGVTAQHRLTAASGCFLEHLLCCGVLWRPISTRTIATFCSQVLRRRGQKFLARVRRFTALPLYRLTPEFAYGLTKTTELGFYLLSTRDPAGNLHADGVKARIKYIAQHDLVSGPFRGVNLEVGRSSRRVSETPWNAEIKGIFGLHAGNWTLAVNPNIDWSLSQGGGPVTGDVDFKANYAIDAKTQVGLESYNELGPLRHLSTSGKNGRTVFAVVDKDFGKVDLTAALGQTRLQCRARGRVERLTSRPSPAAQSCRVASPVVGAARPRWRRSRRTRR